jgi:hypothetical protein
MREGLRERGALALREQGALAEPAVRGWSKSSMKLGKGRDSRNGATGSAASGRRGPQ